MRWCSLFFFLPEFIFIFFIFHRRHFQIRNHSYWGGNLKQFWPIKNFFWLNFLFLFTYFFFFLIFFWRDVFFLRSCLIFLSFVFCYTAIQWCCILFVTFNCLWRVIYNFQFIERVFLYFCYFSDIFLLKFDINKN